MTKASLSQTMERYRVIGSVDNFDGQQDLDEWIQMIERAAEFAGWGADHSFKAALFRLRGEAGEYAEQLREEGKITSWKDLKEALKERFNTAGKEQWHQYLLNTATQGSKTVHEWAQTVRKISLLAVGDEGKPPAPAAEEEGAVGGGGASERIAGAAQNEGRKKLLDYMRKSNFVRGLRSSLRQMVWRKKCSTFDEAVRAAAEEETVEASHREGEVLSCYRRDIPDLTGTALVEQIVAALETREEAKQKKQEKAQIQEELTGGTATKMQPGHVQGFSTGSDDPSNIQNGQQYGMFPTTRQAPIQQYYHGPAPGRIFQEQNVQRYGEQLPLPRAVYPRPGNGRRQEWARSGWRGAPAPARRGVLPPGVDQYGNPVCFFCQERGHFKRECPQLTSQQPGNESRRLQ